VLIKKIDLKIAIANDNSIWIKQMSKTNKKQISKSSDSENEVCELGEEYDECAKKISTHSLKNIRIQNTNNCYE